MDSNQLYLHHGDSPGSILVTQLLTSDNYYTRSQSMFMALIAKNKLQFINGALPKPHSSDPDFFCLYSLQQYGVVLDHQLCI
jgi:hypothetical protein